MHPATLCIRRCEPRRLSRTKLLARRRRLPPISPGLREGLFVMLLPFLVRPHPPAALSRRGAICMLAALACGLAAGKAAAQTASYRVGDLIVQGPWARATPAGAQGGRAYLNITNTG